MKASVVDLRYKMNEVLKALDRNEKIKILYHGKIRGIISPAPTSDKGKVKDHPFFGMSVNETIPVNQVMEDLRGSRYRDI
ncbi:MAG: type II toxin-antitoxin system Phd/YefM family antitoxin [Calditrichaeota bacterium]|nr:type II toxin-antitoxin system Phd/YefM family antitoxin [Calditrichota bacterium]